jgi:hypothetical protein
VEARGSESERLTLIAPHLKVLNLIALNAVTLILNMLNLNMAANIAA